ncbi:hypothetical protein quinque_012337 [Culex quinquefasciatus]
MNQPFTLIDSRRSRFRHNGFHYHKSGPVRRGITWYRCALMRRLKCKASLSVGLAGDVHLGKHGHNHAATKPATTTDLPTAAMFTGKKLVFQGRDLYRHGSSEQRLYWRCAGAKAGGCNFRLHTDYYGRMVQVKNEHTCGSSDANLPKVSAVPAPAPRPQGGDLSQLLGSIANPGVSYSQAVQGQPESSTLFTVEEFMCLASELFTRLSNCQSKAMQFLAPQRAHYQFGFKPGHSTVHQLARISEMVKRGFLAGKSTGMILLDVEKAYDSVWQDAVVYKLFRSNLQPFLVKIVESFLTNRSFTVTQKCITWQRWDSNPRLNETGALNQRLRPLGHATLSHEGRQKQLNGYGFRLTMLNSRTPAR